MLSRFPELDSFRAQVRRFVEEKVPTEYIRTTRNEGMLAPAEQKAWVHLLYEQGGWSCPSWPVENGGPGWSYEQQYVFEQELAAMLRRESAENEALAAALSASDGRLRAAEARCSMHEREARQREAHGARPQAHKHVDGRATRHENALRRRRRNDVLRLCKLIRVRPHLSVHA